MKDKQDPIAHAARLLREAAEEWRDAHPNPAGNEDFEGRPDAKAAHDEHMAAAQALEDWELAVGAGGVQAMRAAPAELEQLKGRIARIGLDIDRALRGMVNTESPVSIERLQAIAALADGPAGSGGWQSHAQAMERERDYYRQRAQTMHGHQSGECWYWQGDGCDNLQSLVNSLPVVIRADQLRALIAGGVQALSAAPAGFVPVAAFDRLHAHAESLAARLLAASPTPPAEQQAAPKAAPGEPMASAAKGAIMGAAYDFRDAHISGSMNLKRSAHAALEDAVDNALAAQSAPQQGAQEPVAYVEVSQSDAEVSMTWGPEPAGFNLPTGRYALYAAPQPAPAPLSEMPYEKRKAIQEGEQISASDAWFHARFNMLDTLDRRNVFRAGFDRGWNAAIAAQGGKA